MRSVLKELGAKMRFWKVAVRPGQPLTFGVLEGKPVFGLPGNPVSSMVSFEQFVRPAILKMSGYRNIFRTVVDAILEEDLSHKPGRKRFLRGIVRVEDGKYHVRTTGEQGSGILMSMVKSNGLIVLPEDRTVFMAGEEVISQAKILRKNGQKRDVEFNNRRIDISGVSYMHTTTRDVTHRIKMLEILRNKQNRHPGLF